MMPPDPVTTERAISLLAGWLSMSWRRVLNAIRALPEADAGEVSP